MHLKSPLLQSGSWRIQFIIFMYSTSPFSLFFFRLNTTNISIFQHRSCFLELWWLPSNLLFWSSSPRLKSFFKYAQKQTQYSSWDLNFSLNSVCIFLSASQHCWLMFSLSATKNLAPLVKNCCLASYSTSCSWLWPCSKASILTALHSINFKILF